MTNLLLYAITVVMWGTSWLAIKYQLGVVAPEASVVYRFALATAVMVAVCLAGRRRMRFSAGEHVFLALQGALLFSTNYYLVYLGTQYLTSGLVAVAFSSLVVMNIIGGAVFFGTTITTRVVLGAGLGMCGLVLVFWPEIVAFDLTRDGTMGLILALGGTLLAALGMLTSARNQRHGLPVIQANAYGMAYGTLFMGVYTVLLGKPFDFDPSFSYVVSLLYLAVFASVVAFWCYLTLQVRIGAGRTAYAAVLFPIIALALSTLFEGFQWTPTALGGVVLVLAGNALVLAPGSPARRPATQEAA